MGGVFIGDNLLQTVLPVSLVASGIRSGVAVGVLLAVSQGLGIVCAPAAIAWADANGRGPVLLIGCAIICASTFTLGWIANAEAALWIWVIPILIYGAARTSSLTNAIALVSTTGDPWRVQGFNALVQRGAAAMTAVIAALVIAHRSWQWGFWSISVTSLVAASLALGASPRRAPGPGAVAPRYSYRRSFEILLREGPIQASSLLNVSSFVVLLLGNSFYPIFLRVPRSEAAYWVLALLLCRDLTSVIISNSFAFLAKRLGLRFLIAGMGCCSVSGLCLLGIGGTRIVWVIVAAILQGFAMVLSIGSTNVMAILSGGGGSGMRLVATNYVNSAASLVLPLVFGLIFDSLGGRALFLIGASVSGLLIVAVLQRANAWIEQQAVGAHLIPQGPCSGNSPGPGRASSLGAGRVSRWG